MYVSLIRGQKRCAGSRGAAEPFHKPSVEAREGTVAAILLVPASRLRDLVSLNWEEAMQKRTSAEKRTSEAVHDIGENARQAAGRVQESSSRAAEGFREYQLKVLSATQANVNALFEYAHHLLRAQSMSELVDVSTAHSRHQFEMMAEQTRELASSAQKIATETTRPLTSAFGSQGAQMS